MISWSYEDLRADGVSLKNYGYGVSLVGGLSAVPPRKGSNIPVAYKRGTSFRPKTFDQITRQLTMWIDARDPATGLYPEGWMARVAQRNENMLAVYSIFGNPEQQIRFERDVLLEDGVKHTWFGYGEYAGDALQVNWGDNSDEETNFNIDLVFADPLWYDTISVTSDAISASGSAVGVSNSGKLPVLDMDITFTASTTLTNPVLTNTTNGVSVSLTTAISGGDSVVVETKYPRVKRTSDNANLIGVVSNSGARSFMLLDVGTNNLQLTADSGTGNAVVTFYPPYF